MNIVFCLAIPPFSQLKYIIEKLTSNSKNNIYILIFKTTFTLNKMHKKIDDILIQVKNYQNKKIIIINKMNELKYFYSKNNINYTFFNTPYEEHFGRNAFSIIGNNSKIIGIPYGIDSMDGDGDLCWYNGIYLRNCHTYCMDIDYNINIVNRYLDKHNAKNCNIIDIGYPKIEYLRKNIYESNEKQILLSFRWVSCESQISFYENYFVKLCKNNKDITLCYRPHPASHSDYHGSINNNNLLNTKLNNLIIDYSFDVEDSFSKSLFFIVDYSSLMVEYMLITKKPVIYLYSPKYKFNKFGQISLEVMYTAHNISELNTIIFDLLNGNDYKKNIREEFVNKYYKSNGSTDKLIEYMISNI
tara:strand:+ start:1740 stop:2813 length:1074 start_codon:yes stop_codon:yes gene_type:complete